ncbi:MAG: hypothetical protein ACKVQK_29360 [Burkholderiales bacterium]
MSKLFFDMQSPANAEEYAADPNKVLSRYPLKPEVLKSLQDNDVAALAPKVNPYLLRFYFFAIGKSESWFLERIRALANKETVNG